MPETTSPMQLINQGWYLCFLHLFLTFDSFGEMYHAKFLSILFTFYKQQVQVIKIVP